MNLLKLFEGYRSKLNINCLGYVLMPDHLHALLFQTEDGEYIPSLMQGFKSISTRRYRPLKYPETQMWSDRYDDVYVPGPDAIRTKLDYMHNSPVRRGLVERPDEYRWSSARDYWEIEKGIIEIFRPSLL